MPAWRQGIDVGVWTPIQNSALSQAPISVVASGDPASKIIAWTGLALDTRDSSLYSAANGGHTDYAGNEVDRIRLSDAVPAWTEIRAATAPAQITQSVTHYADGRPTSRHSYYGTLVNENRNRIMLVGGSRWGNGFGIGGVTDGFDLATSDWDPAGTYPAGSGSDFVSLGFAMVDDRSSGDIYAFVNFTVVAWSNATNTWTRKVNNASVYGQYAATAFDSSRNRILVLGGNNNDSGYYDVATNSVVPVTVTGPALASVVGQGYGMVYDPLLDAYLVVSGGGGAVYRIDAQTFVADTLSVSGAGNVPAAINNVWRRFLYVPALKGVVYAPTYDSDLWFLRTN
jgi:hypothetical protein